jgi:Rrf2 family protein
MKISTRVRYGMRLMLELALHHSQGPIFLKDIARKQDISEKYLSQIIIPLRTAGLVKSFRGAHGGYELQREPEAITLRQVMEALEGDLCLVDCIADAAVCDRVGHCVTQQVWRRLGQVMAETLEKTTLKDLVTDFDARFEAHSSYAI